MGSIRPRWAWCCATTTCNDRRCCTTRRWASNASSSAAMRRSRSAKRSPTPSRARSGVHCLRRLLQPGRHHWHHVVLAWDEVVARAFDDSDDRMRLHAIDAFRFVPLRTSPRGTVCGCACSPGRRRAALGAGGAEPGAPSARRLAPLRAPRSSAPQTRLPGPRAESSSNCSPRKRQRSAAGRSSASCSELPPARCAATAIAFETFFVARLLQALAARRRRLVSLVFAWSGSRSASASASGWRRWRSACTATRRFTMCSACWLWSTRCSTPLARR